MQRTTIMYMAFRKNKKWQYASVSFCYAGLKNSIVVNVCLVELKSYGTNNGYVEKNSVHI